MEHTKGPWKVIPNYVSPVQGVGAAVEDTKEHRVVAEMFGTDEFSAEAEANAQLMAASHEMLEALERLTIVGSAATGFLMSSFSDMHEYVEELLGRPVFNAEMGDKDTAEKIRHAAGEDFREAIEAARAAIEQARSN